MAEVYMAGDFRNGTTFEMEGNVPRTCFVGNIDG